MLRAIANIKPDFNFKLFKKNKQQVNDVNNVNNVINYDANNMKKIALENKDLLYEVELQKTKKLDRILKQLLKNMKKRPIHKSDLCYENEVHRPRYPMFWLVKNYGMNHNNHTNHNNPNNKNMNQQNNNPYLINKYHQYYEFNRGYLYIVIDKKLLAKIQSIFGSNSVDLFNLYYRNNKCFIMLGTYDMDYDSPTSLYNFLNVESFDYNINNTFQNIYKINSDHSINHIINEYELVIKNFLDKLKQFNDKLYDEFKRNVQSWIFARATCGYNDVCIKIYDPYKYMPFIGRLNTDMTNNGYTITSEINKEKDENEYLFITIEW